MTPRRPACLLVCSCVLLLMQAAASADAAPPVSGWAAAAPGTISTLAGGPLLEGMATTFGQGVSAMAVSGQTLYIADSGADVIRAVDMSTDEERVIAGTSAAGYGGDGGPANAAELDGPHGLTVDPQGDLLIADTENDRVRLIAAADCDSDCPYGLPATTKGDIYTIAGTGTANGSMEGPAVDAGVQSPSALAIDSDGDLMIATWETVLMIADRNCSASCPYGLPEMTKGDIYRAAGLLYHEPLTGDGGPATSAGMNPRAVAVDGEGDLLILDDSDIEDQVQMVAATNCTSECPYGLPATVAGDIYTIAGGGNEAPQADGLASKAHIHAATIALDGEGNVVFGEGGEEGELEIVSAKACMSGCPYGLTDTTANHVYPIAGGGTELGNGVPASQASLIGPWSIAIAPNTGVLLVSDQFVRLLATGPCSGQCPFALPATTANDMYTVAGNGTEAFSGESGSPTELELGWPRAVTSNAAGDVLVLDAHNGRVRMIAATHCDSDCAYGLPATVQGDMYTIAGGGSSLQDGVPASSELLLGVQEDGEPAPGEIPTSMTVDAAGDVLVLDGGNRVRLIAAGNCTAACPYGLPTMVEGDLYTVAGDGGLGDSGDGGPATNAQLGGGARGMAVDPEGDLLIADTSTNRVRLLADVACAADCPYGLPTMTKGDIYTIVGTGEPGDKGDNKPAIDAELFEPADVAVDGEGNLLITDTLALQVRFVAARSCSSDCPYGRSSMTAGDMYPLAGDGARFYPEEVGTDGDGASAAMAPMQPPQAVAVDSAGNVLIGESEGSSGRSVVRMVAAATCTSDCAYGLPATVKGDIYTVAGVNSTTSGFSGDGGPATSAYLDGPTGLGFDSAGDLLIADTYNNRIRLVTPAAKPQPSKEPEGGTQQPEAGGGPKSEGNTGAGPGAGSGSSSASTVKVTVPVNTGVRVTLPIRALAVTPRGLLSIVLDFSAPMAGSIRLTRSVRSHRGKHVFQLLATARFSASRAGAITLRLQLTHTGLALLKGTHRLNCVLAVLPTADTGMHPTFLLDIHSSPGTHRHGG
jgi:trimeric autotransporter adhesin